MTATTKPHNASKLTFDADETADFLRVHRNTVLELAENGELPGAKIGRAWVFLVEDLVAYLKTQVRAQQKRRRSGDQKPKHIGSGRRWTPPSLPELPSGSS